MSDSLLGFPQFDQWIEEHCASSPDPFIKVAPQSVYSLVQLGESITSPHGWRFSDEKAIANQIAGLTTARELNDVYWKDQVSNLEAYEALTIWRSNELLKPAIRALNLKELITPAVLARSLLELAVVFLFNANTVERSANALKFDENQVVVSQEFEALAVKMIWGTRFGEPNEAVRQTNVMTYIQKLSKNPQTSSVETKYNFLCELAHPNVVGNLRFWSHVQATYPDGSELRILSKNAFDGQDKIVDEVLWALSWSSQCLVNCRGLFRNAVAEILGKCKRA